jgi:hypothetical protein
VKNLGPLFNRALLLGGLAGIIYPAFIEGPPGKPAPSLTQAIIGLILEPKPELGYFMRVLSLFVVVAFGYVVIIEWLYRKLPITAVQTNISIGFNQNYSLAVVNRSQVLRANQASVSAYFSLIAPTSPSGATPRADIAMDAFCYGCELKSSKMMIGADDRGFEIIHDFGADIPYRWYMPLIPSWAMKKDLDKMARFLRNNLVRRTQSAAYIDDFTGENPSMSFRAANYPQRNISIEVEFDAPIPKDWFFAVWHG